MKKAENLPENKIVVDYANFKGITELAAEYHTSKERIKDILVKNGIELRDKKSLRQSYKVIDPQERKYINDDLYYFVAVAKDTGEEFRDIDNKGGHITTYIREHYGIETPSLHERRQYYRKTGDYWWEQWFDVVKRERPNKKKCPYCGWATVDLDNKSGAFGAHLAVMHHKSIAEYLEEHPEDTDYFSVHKRKEERKELLKLEQFRVFCPICGEPFNRLSWSHIKTHGLTNEEFKEKYPYIQLMSKDALSQVKDAAEIGRSVVSKDRFVSHYEREIQDFLRANSIEFETNRQILEGKEIDILIPDKKLGIEFDGLKWHTEWFGKKSHGYHLEKTLVCNRNGYGLIHIFEDEFHFKKDIVFHKLSHALGLDYTLPRIYARKTIVKPIYKHEAEEFLNKFHIQGFVSASVYLGCFIDRAENGTFPSKRKLIAVMSFKNGNIKNPSWELVRFATDYNYICCGVGSKMFKHFVMEYQPHTVVSFADRKWTVDPYNNLYTKLGFTLDRFNPPDYRYYKDDSKDDTKYKRVHKMFLNKKKLSKEYGFPMEMTETEMARELGYDRIWDCGLIRYVWTKG